MVGKKRMPRGKRQQKQGSKKSQQRIQVRTVACPKCKVVIGEQCIGFKGSVREANHEERVYAYQQKPWQITRLTKKTHKPEKHKTPDYREYLNSKEWQIKRSVRLALPDSGECWTCGTSEFVEGKHVHHRSYKNLGNETMDDLVITCKNCNMVKIPALVILFKKHNLVSAWFQWHATDYLRRQLRGDAGIGCKLSLEQFERIRVVVDNLLHSC